MYISILYIRGKQKFISLQTLLPHIYSKKLSNKLSEMCSIPYKFLPQNVFTGPSFLPCSSGISNVALLNLNLLPNFCPFYTNQYLPNVYNRQG